MSDTITMPRAVVQQALSDICAARLCEVNSMSSRQEMLRLMIRATDNLRAALEQQAEPVQTEPAGYRKILGQIPAEETDEKFLEEVEATNAAPALREWQGLTDQERRDIEDGCETFIGLNVFEDIEAALKKKNLERQR
jgi:hypothetical protein